MATLWTISDGRVDYAQAVHTMEACAAGIVNGTAEEMVWLLEHPPLYTAGTSSRDEHLTAPSRFPVYQSGRGGQYTYHGPGQRILYAMLDLRRRGRDVRAYVHALEDVIIDTLDAFALRGERRDGRVGVWVRRTDGTEHKVAAIGVRVKRWITLHGLAINVDPDLSHFSGIVPCGIAEHGVTSLAAEGRIVTMAEVDMALRRAFEARFGPTQLTDPSCVTPAA